MRELHREHPRPDQLLTAATTDSPYFNPPGRHHHLRSVPFLPTSSAPRLTAPTPGLIERAQFAYNPRMYTKEGFADVLHHDGFEGSWLEWLLRETEMSHGAFDRSVRPALVLMILQPRSVVTTGTPSQELAADSS